MAKYITLLNGDVQTLEEKNKEILENLRPTVDSQLSKIDFRKQSSAIKGGAVVSNKLLELFRAYGLMNESEIETLDADDLQQYYLGFMQIINRVSMEIEITPTKPLFCAYMGITTTIFNKFENSKDEKIQLWLDAINGDLTHSILSSSLEGNASEKTAIAYATTKNYGQEIQRMDVVQVDPTIDPHEMTPKQALARAMETMALIDKIKIEHKVKKKSSEEDGE
jgi:hypothetical protein